MSEHLSMVETILLLIVSYYKEHGEKPIYILISNDLKSEWFRQMRKSVSTFHGLAVIDVKGHLRLELA